MWEGLTGSGAKCSPRVNLQDNPSPRTAGLAPTHHRGQQRSREGEEPGKHKQAAPVFLQVLPAMCWGSLGFLPGGTPWLGDAGPCPVPLREFPLGGFCSAVPAPGSSRAVSGSC